MPRFSVEGMSSTTRAATADASTSQPNFYDSFISSANEGEDEVQIDDEKDQSEEEEVTSRPAFTPSIYSKAAFDKKSFDEFGDKRGMIVSVVVIVFELMLIF